MRAYNLLQGIPRDLPSELIEQLAVSESVRIERIVSKGHRSPPDFWYDQTENEWVMLVKGEAKLRFEASNELIHLTAGMHLTIAAHARHRVEWTKEDEETVWVGVFY